MTVDEICAALKDRNLSVVSEKTGVHRNTLATIKNGDNRNPTYRVLTALSSYLRPEK